MTRETACPGCGWAGYVHRHDDAEDGPRDGCCVHTCGASCRHPLPGDEPDHSAHTRHVWHDRDRFPFARVQGGAIR